MSTVGYRRRVVVTGMGAITCMGLSVDALWDGLINGKSGIRVYTFIDPEYLPCKVAGEVKGFEPDQFMDRKEARRMARFSQLAVAATSMAIEDADLNLSKENPERIGVVMGNGFGGLPDVEVAAVTMLEKGILKINPFFFPIAIPNMAAANVSRLFGFKGYTSTIVTACAASTQSIGDALEAIRRGTMDVALAGGTEAALCGIGAGGFINNRSVTRHNDPPEEASRPFDATRDGFVASEGSAMLVMESMEHALDRGADILSEIVGFGVTSDAYHLVQPCIDGDGAARAISCAIFDAGISPEDIDYVNAHGTSTPLNDSIETMAIKTALGESAYQVPISATKSMIGHALGAAGAIEAVACVKTILNDEIPPTINYQYPDPECDLDYVPNVSRRVKVDTALSNSFGFGGQNACLVFRRFEE